MNTDKRMSSLERKTRLEALYSMSACDDRRRNEDSFFRKETYGPALVAASLLGGFALVTHNRSLSQIALLLGVLLAGLALLRVLWRGSNRRQMEDSALAPAEVLDALLLAYSPVDQSAYRALQQSVQSEKELSSEALRTFIANERRAINEHLSPHVPWEFANKKLDG